MTSTEPHGPLTSSELADDPIVAAAALGNSYLHDVLCELLHLPVNGTAHDTLINRVASLIDRSFEPSVATDPDSPVDPFDKVVAEIVALNRSKRADYTGGRGPWANFEDTAAQVGTTPAQVVEMMIANKQSRLRSLAASGAPNHESIRDTKLDRAVYAIIALAMEDAAPSHDVIVRGERG